MPAAGPIMRTLEYTFSAEYRARPGSDWTEVDRFRLRVELTASPDRLPETGMIGDPDALRRLQGWFQETFGALKDELATDGALARRARSLDAVIAGPFDLAALARFVWEAWHEPIPELSSVVAVKVEREAADWPRGSSDYATRFTADFRHRVFLQRVASRDALVDDPGRCDSRWGGQLVKAGWAAFRSASEPPSTPAIDTGHAWQAAITRAMDGAVLAETLNQFETWLQACAAFGTAVNSAGCTDDLEARQAVWRARNGACRASQPWLESLAEALDRERWYDQFCGRPSSSAWLLHPLAYREHPQIPEWHLPLEALLAPAQ